MTIVATYVTYLVISIAVTIWVGRTLYKNGRIFLVDAFHENEPLADSVNHLLVVGFYLVNIGFVSLFLKTADAVVDTQSGIELLSRKEGIVLVVLGFMHFFNIVLLSSMRKNARLSGALNAALGNPAKK